VSVDAAPLVADLRHFLLPSFFAFGVVFVISFRLLNKFSPCSSGRSSLPAPVISWS
jgi:hypothetical protein